MTNPQFTEANFRELLEAIQDRASSFNAHMHAIEPHQLHNRPIYLRFDVDNDFRKSFEASCICNEYGIKATFFILNTAPYWRDASLFRFLNEMQDKGHEIAWHNNALAQWHSTVPKDTVKPAELNESWMYGIIHRTLDDLNHNGLRITGSSSHGDQLCRKLGFINYEIFEECPRTSEADGFPKPSFDFPRVKMSDFGLEYEAYHVPYDLYLSESGGGEWTSRSHGDKAQPIGLGGMQVAIANYDRIQILIHPQHWKI